MGKIGWGKRTYFLLASSALAILGVVFLSISSSPTHQITYQAGDNLTSVSAKNAYDFVNNIGVVTHLTYPNYFDRYDTVKSKLRKLGIRQLRDEFGDLKTASFNTNKARFNELSNPTDGSVPISFNFTVKLDDDTDGDTSFSSDPRSSCFYDKLRHLLTGAGFTCGNVPFGTDNSLRVKVTSLENPNEPDYRPGDYQWPQCGFNYNANWPDEVLAISSQLKAKSQGLPILAPSFVKLKNFSSCSYGGTNLLQYITPIKSNITFGNVHAYCHKASVNGCYEDQVAYYRNFYNALPLVMTETGYSTHSYDQAQQSRMLPRILLDFFYRGISRIYIYEFMNELGDATSGDEQNYGLIGSDGSEKPAFTSLKNLLSLMNDSRAANLPALDLSIAGSNVRHSLYGKSDGSYVLALFNDADNTNNTTQNTSATVRFKSEKNVEQFKLSSTSPTATNAKSSSINVSVPNEVMLLRITDPSGTSSGGGASGGGTNASKSSKNKSGSSPGSGLDSKGEDRPGELSINGKTFEDLSLNISQYDPNLLWYIKLRNWLYNLFYIIALWAKGIWMYWFQ